MAELSLIQYNVMNFFHLVLTSQPFSPITTKVIKIVEALISSEDTKTQDVNENKKDIERVKWIYQNTHEKVLLPLSVIELAVFKNIDRRLNGDIDIGEKTFNLIVLYQYLDEIISELTRKVIEIAKRYSIDIPMYSQSRGSGSSTTINI